MAPTINTLLDLLDSPYLTYPLKTLSALQSLILYLTPHLTTSSSPVLQYIQDKLEEGDLKSLLMMVVIFYFSLKMVNMALRSVFGWIFFVIRALFYLGVAGLGFWIYQAGVETVVTVVAGWVAGAVGSEGGRVVEEGWGRVRKGWEEAGLKQQHAGRTSGRAYY